MERLCLLRRCRRAVLARSAWSAAIRAIKIAIDAPGQSGSAVNRRGPRQRNANRNSQTGFWSAPGRNHDGLWIGENVGAWACAIVDIQVHKQ